MFEITLIITLKRVKAFLVVEDDEVNAVVDKISR